MHRVKSDKPSFQGLQPANPASSYAKKMNRSTGTSHECALRSLLWKSGLRFRKNVKSLPGKPDILSSIPRGLPTANIGIGKLKDISYSPWCRVLNVKELASLLGVSEKQIYALRDRAPSHRSGSGRP